MFPNFLELRIDAGTKSGALPFTLHDRKRKKETKKRKSPKRKPYTEHELLLQVFLSFPSHPHRVLRLCCRSSHGASACCPGCCNYSDEVLMADGRLVEPLPSWVLICKPWHSSVPSSSNTTAKLLCLSLTACAWQAPGTAKYLHLQVIPWESLVQLGAQQPLCWSINSQRCLLWS